MTNKNISDFGLYCNEWKEGDQKKKFSYLVLSVFVIIGLGCLYSIVRICNKTVTEDNISIDTLEAEKLILPIPLREEKEEYPRPFGMSFKEPMPSVFRVSSTTEKVTTISYPQLARYKNNYQPRNIQDILRYTAPILKTKNYDKINPMDGYQKQYTASNMNQFVSQQYPRNNFEQNQMSKNHDPFFAYKPQDPSDINLMATASVRFAPPPWKNMNQPMKINENSPIMPDQPFMNGLTRDKFGRPLILTLNVFPMTERDRIMMTTPHRGPVSLLGKMLTNRDFEGRFGNNNMILRLNLFPEALTNLEMRKFNVNNN